MATPHFWTYSLQSWETRGAPCLTCSLLEALFRTRSCRTLAHSTGSAQLCPRWGWRLQDAPSQAEKALGKTAPAVCLTTRPPATLPGLQLYTGDRYPLAASFCVCLLPCRCRKRVKVETKPVFTENRFTFRECWEECLAPRMEQWKEREMGSSCVVQQSRRVEDWRQNTRADNTHTQRRATACRLRHIQSNKAPHTHTSVVHVCAHTVRGCPEGPLHTHAPCRWCVCPVTAAPGEATDAIPPLSFWASKLCIK